MFVLLYCCKNGDLPVHSCANVLLVFRGSVFVDVGCYLLDDFARCFVVDVCVDYVCVSVFEMLLDCVFCVF